MYATSAGISLTIPVFREVKRKPRKTLVDCPKFQEPERSNEMPHVQLPMGLENQTTLSGQGWETSRGVGAK